MHPDTHLLKLGHGAGHINGITAQAIQLGHDQYVALFHLIEQASKFRTLRDSNGPGDRLGDNSMWFDLEASGFNFRDLILRLLVDGRDAGVGKSSGHRTICYKIGVRNFSDVLNYVKLSFGHPSEGCPKGNDNGHAQNLSTKYCLAGHANEAR